MGASPGYSTYYQTIEAARMEYVEPLCHEHPYAINWGPVRPSTPRMSGLHPEYPHPKWKPNKINDLDQK